MITLSPLERTVTFVFVFFVKESDCTCWPDRALFRARLMSLFAISDKHVSEVPVSDMSVREIVSKISLH
jgi:hypothetical protein